MPALALTSKERFWIRTVGNIILTWKIVVFRLPLQYLQAYCINCVWRVTPVPQKSCIKY